MCISAFIECDQTDRCDGVAECDLCVDECHCTNYYDYGIVYKRTEHTLASQVSCNDCGELYTH